MYNSTAGVIKSENIAGIPFFLRFFIWKYSSLKFHNVIKIENFVVNYNMGFNVLTTMSKKDIAHTFILLCTELIQSCLVIISPTQKAIVVVRKN